MEQVHPYTCSFTSNSVRSQATSIPVPRHVNNYHMTNYPHPSWSQSTHQPYLDRPIPMSYYQPQPYVRNYGVSVMNIKGNQQHSNLYTNDFNRNLNYIQYVLDSSKNDEYVALDSKLMGAIVNAIDTILPIQDLIVLTNVVEHEVELNEKKITPKEDPVNESKMEYEQKTLNMYEPVSPVSSCESCCGNEDKWEPPKDAKTLQKLFEIHFC